MEKFLTWLKSLPTWALGLLLAGVGGAFVMAFMVFSSGGEEVSQQQGPSSVVLSVQEATNDDSEKSNMSRYATSEASTSGVDATREWWDQLAVSEGGGGSSASSAGQQSPTGDGPLSAAPAAKPTPSNVYLDPSIYTELEIYNIRQGFTTKEEVDAARARRQAEKVRREEEARKNRPLTQEQRDSAYFARMERLVDKMSGNPQGVAQPTGTPAKEEKPKEELPAGITKDEEGNRHIDFTSEQVASASSAGWSNDNIFSSLDGNGPSGVEVERNGLIIHPAKATFLRNERIVSGQRVTLRLLEDLHLNNGAIIPANTHVTGTVGLSGRMQIGVRNVQLSGRILSTDLSAFDLDGTEGIYCPAAQSGQAKQAGKNVATEAASGIASAVTSVFSRSNILGNVAGSGVREISRVALSDGTQAVDVFAGYEFYLFENIKQNQ